MRRWHPGPESHVRDVSPLYPRALPALFFAGVLAAGFAADGLAADATGPRALLTASDFGFVADFLTAAFLTGFGALASAFAGFAALAFLAPRLGLPPPFATRSSIKAIASGSVMVSTVLSLGMVALTPPGVT